MPPAAIPTPFAPGAQFCHRLHLHVQWAAAGVSLPAASPGCDARLVVGPVRSGGRTPGVCAVGYDGLPAARRKPGGRSGALGHSSPGMGERLAPGRSATALPPSSMPGSPITLPTAGATNARQRERGSPAGTILPAAQSWSVSDCPALSLVPLRGALPFSAAQPDAALAAGRHGRPLAIPAMAW